MSATPQEHQRESRDVSHTEPDEETPLLSQTSAAGSQLPVSTPASSHQHKKKFYPYALILLGLMCVTADLGGDLVDAPEIRLLEMAVCRDYYRVHDPSVIGDAPLSYVEEHLCKKDKIQVELAYIRATKSLLMNIPGLLCTFYYGRLADRKGRKPVVLLGLTGQLLAMLWMVLICYFHEIFPTRMVLISPIFIVVGGGNRILTAMTNTIVADVAPDHTRTMTLYLLSIAVSVTQFLAIPLGTWLLSKDLWLPWWFSITVMLFAYPIILALPETRPNASTESPPTTEQSPSSKHWMMTSVKTRLVKTITTLTTHREINFCLTILFLFSFSLRCNSVFVQYVSNLLDWPISKVGYLLAIRAGVTLLFLIGLAVMSRIFHGIGGSNSLRLDITVVQCSFCLMIVGAFAIGTGSDAAFVIAGSILLASGGGVPSAMQGIVAVYAKSKGNGTAMGQIYAGLAIAELAAGLFGSLAYAGLLNMGLKLGGWGFGLPYYISAILLFMALLLTSTLTRNPSSTENEND